MVKGAAGKAEMDASHGAAGVYGNPRRIAQKMAPGI